MVRASSLAYVPIKERVNQYLKQQNVKPREPRVTAAGSFNSTKFSDFQLQARDILEGSFVKYFMGFVILLNAVQVVYETDRETACKWDKVESACDQVRGWLLVMNWIYLSLYIVEMCCRVYVYRTQYFYNRYDLIDAAIILSGVISEALGGLIPSTGILRLFRLVRLTRAARFIRPPKEFHIMINGFMSALHAISGGAALVFLMLTIWSVIMVGLLNDPNHDEELLAFYASYDECYWAPRAWSSIFNTMFTLVQLMLMGEGWQCNAIPLIERNWWALLLFICVFFTVVLGMTNLILAVIVDKAMLVHEEDLEEHADARMRKKDRAVNQFIEHCRSLDVDETGTLSLQELLEGFDTNANFRDVCDILDIAKDELEILYHMMDRDSSGDVSFIEFGTELGRLKNDNLQTICSFTKFHVTEILWVVHHLERKMIALQTNAQMNQGSKGLMRSTHCLDESLMYRSRALGHSLRLGPSHHDSAQAHSRESKHVVEQSREAADRVPLERVPLEPQERPESASAVLNGSEMKDSGAAAQAVDKALVTSQQESEGVLQPNGSAQTQAFAGSRSVEAQGLLDHVALDFKGSEWWVDDPVAACQALPVIKNSQRSFSSDQLPDVADKKQFDKQSFQRQEQDSIGYASLKTNVCQPLLDELKQVEERLMAGFAQLLRENSSNSSCFGSGRRANSLLCLPAVNEAAVHRSCM